MPQNNIYNIDREFDYPTIKGIVVKSLEKIAKEAARIRQMSYLILKLILIPS